MKVEGVQVNYLLSLNEFAILANSCGIQRIYSFIGNQSEKMKWETFIYTLHQLVKKDIINVSEKIIQVKEPYSTFFKMIKEADKVITLDTDKSLYPEKCCYLTKGNMILITETSNTQEDTLRIYQIKKREFVNYILEEGYLTYEARDVDFDKRTEKRIITGVQCLDITGEKIIKKLHFCLDHSQCYIDQGVNEQTVRLDYSLQVLKEEINEMIGEDDNTEC